MRNLWLWDKFATIVAYIKAIINYNFLTLSLALILASTSVAQAQTPPPDPITDLQTRVNRLESNSGISPYLGTAIAIVAVLGALGFIENTRRSLISKVNSRIQEVQTKAEASIADANQRAEDASNESQRKIQQYIDDAFRRADARHLTVYIPNSTDFQAKRTMLEASGFQGLRDYDSLDLIDRATLAGIFVYSIPAQVVAIQDPVARDAGVSMALADLKSLMDRKHVDGKQFGVVIDYPGYVKNPDQILSPHYNFIFANSQATLIPRIFEVARMLTLS